ncbi:sensor histidine kinase [Alistipes shahii]|uniref:sensor histidine kinase n=1 Tax=Alistipes shahii TaxID=328814 RepID=UPI0030793B47
MMSLPSASSLSHRWEPIVSLGCIPEGVMCFSCFASENGVMLPAPPDSLQTWRPRAIDLIRSLYPQVENIALVTDNTYGGISLQALVRAEWENYPDLNLVLVDSREGEETAFRTYATLPPRSAVMLGTWRVGSDGEYFMQRSLNDLVQNNPRVPVFSVTGTGIGDTAIGGYVPEYENGAEVIANQIRKYYDTDDIEDAHFHTSKSLYLFDSRKLKEWKIAEYALPKGSVIEDTMAAKLSKYSHYIELLVAGILLLVLLLFVTWLLLRMRRLKLTLEEREGQLVVAREKAEESDMLKSAFLANMSHEIRTPLNAIVGFSSLMQSEELSQEERAEYCAIVVSNSEMLLTLLNDILDISSLECGKIRFNYASEDIVQICRHVMMTTAHTRQRGVEGRFACPVGSFMLTTDAHRLSQILINLLTNAGKFTSEGSITLGVEIDEERGEVLFSVADTGPGIPPDKQDLVFNRFEKLDGNKKKGTGLGLAICRQIAMIVGGRIWVDSAYTGGTRFVFAHPIGIDPGGENREGGGFLPSEQRKSLFVNDAGQLVPEGK